jgi:hypothetical protein
LGTYVRREVTNFTRKQQTPQFGKILIWELARGDLVFTVPKTRPRTLAAEDEMAAAAPTPVPTPVPTPAPAVGPSKPPANISAGAAAAEQGKKVIVQPKVTETPNGVRLTITASDTLNDYSAYRSGDRYFVVLPNADASAVRKIADGQGFTDAKVERRGRDVVLSFRLRPGMTARVNQRFNHLDVVLSPKQNP